jgi:hypothetical protein
MNGAKQDTSVNVNPKNKSQDIGLFFSSMPPWSLFGLIIVASLLIVGAGVLLGYLRYKDGIKESEGPISTAVGATLGLLAFMLAFTFSLTWSRFASRNNLIILQSKAIEACYLRTSYLPETQKIELRKLLKEYTKILISLNIEKGFEEALKKINELQEMIWQQTVSLAQEDMDSELRSLFVQSVNEMISLVIERKIIAMVFRIPDPIWSSLLFLAGMGMLAFGYQSGISGIDRIFELPLLPIAFGVVIVLIADLNSTGVQRRFKVTRKPLEYVLETMDKNML